MKLQKQMIITTTTTTTVQKFHLYQIQEVKIIILLLKVKQRHNKMKKEQVNRHLLQPTKTVVFKMYEIGWKKQVLHNIQKFFLKNGWETTDALILIQETDLKEMGVK